jgi:antagonist of KipI
MTCDELIVERAGFLSSVQDLGRTGFRQFGVSTSGALDPFALRVANLLVGNDEARPDSKLRSAVCIAF